MKKKKRQVLTLPVMLIFILLLILLILLLSTISYDAVGYILGQSVVADDYHPHDGLPPLNDLSQKLVDNMSIASSSVSSSSNSSSDHSSSRQHLFLHDNTVVVLHFQKPRRKFHGNHWFHICEHYLSQHLVIRQRLQQADTLLSNDEGRLTGSHNTSISSSSSSWDDISHGSSSIYSEYTPPQSTATTKSSTPLLLRSIKHVKIITRQHELSAMMTRYSFYLVVLAVYQPGMQSIELFPPVQSYRQMRHGGSHTVTLAPGGRGGGGGGGWKGAESSSSSSSSSSVSRPISSIDEATQSMISFTAQGGPSFGFYAYSSSASNRIVDYSVDTIGIINEHHHHPHHYHNSSRSTVIQDLLAWMMQISSSSSESLLMGDRHPSLDYPTAIVQRDGRQQQQHLHHSSSSSSHHHYHHHQQEGWFIGSVGAAPVKSDQWFHSPDEVATVRQKARSICAVEEPATTTTDYDDDDDGNSRLRLLVYQRDSSRSFLNLSGVLGEISRRGPSEYGVNGTGTWSVRVAVHSEVTRPCILNRLLGAADLFLTSHGFQSTALMFLKEGAYIIEVFPYKYYRESYFHLAHQFGIHHRWIQNPDPVPSSTYWKKKKKTKTKTTKTEKNKYWSSRYYSMDVELLRSISQDACMADLTCRSFARSRDIDMPDSHIQVVLQTMRDIEFKHIS